ncbi:hypothetical protein PR048_013308 [Dryococelus australis]|uniref:Uncharacterized protein n=1 Tax=Dryococelus australis TaxID=614101 RepID=A0ABQ9HTB4_9NEOP|nr:hypothetical protein PR048_013308 [Dryococelus australis]
MEAQKLGGTMQNHEKLCCAIHEKYLREQRFSSLVAPHVKANDLLKGGSGCDLHAHLRVAVTGLAGEVVRRGLREYCQTYKKEKGVKNFMKTLLGRSQISILVKKIAESFLLKKIMYWYELKG